MQIHYIAATSGEAMPMPADDHGLGIQNIGVVFTTQKLLSRNLGKFVARNKTAIPYRRPCTVRKVCHKVGSRGTGNSQCKGVEAKLLEGAVTQVADVQSLVKKCEPEAASKKMTSAVAQ